MSTPKCPEHQSDGCTHTNRNPLAAPVPRFRLKDARTSGAAETAVSLRRQVPGGELEPITADQLALTCVAKGAAPFRVM